MPGGRPDSKEIREIIQEIVSDNFLDDIDLNPSQVREYFVSNIVRRTLAHLQALSSDGPVRLRATAAGYLKVSTYGSAIEDDETFNYTSQDTAVEQSFSQTVQRVEIFLRSGDAKIKFKTEGGSYGDWYYVEDNGVRIISRAVKTFTIDDDGSAFTGYVKGEY